MIFYKKFFWTKILRDVQIKSNKIILEEKKCEARKADIEGTCLYRLGLMYIMYMILWTFESTTLVQCVKR